MRKVSKKKNSSQSQFSGNRIRFTGIDTYDYNNQMIGWFLNNKKSRRLSSGFSVSYGVSRI